MCLFVIYGFSCVEYSNSVADINHWQWLEIALRVYAVLDVDTPFSWLDSQHGKLHVIVPPFCCPYDRLLELPHLSVVRNSEGALAGGA